MAVAVKRTLGILVSLCWAGACSQQAVAGDGACASNVLERFAGQELSYQVDWKGLTMDSRRRIDRLEDGSWRLHNRSSLLFMSIEESSHFALEGDHIRSIAYEHERKGLSDKHDLQLDFAADEYSVHSPRGDGRQPVNGPIWDLLNHQAQLRIDLACSSPQEHYTYAVARRNRASEYDYRLVGDERITTPAGSFDTLVLERGEAGDKLDRVWMARSLDYLIVRLEHEEDDEVAVLELRQDPRVNSAAD